MRANTSMNCKYRNLIPAPKAQHNVSIFPKKGALGNMVVLLFFRVIKFVLSKFK